MSCATSQEPDDGWAKLARAGDEEAFAQLFEKYYDRIRDFAYRVVLDHQSADDVAQETFIRAARRIDQLKKSTAFEPWLYQIARNLSRDRIRSERALRRKLKHAGREHSIATTEVGPGGADSAFDVGEEVLDALRKLSQPQREAVALVYLDGYSHAETAKILDCAESTISWRIFRAKSKLRSLLAVGLQGERKRSAAT